MVINLYSIGKFLEKRCRLLIWPNRNFFYVCGKEVVWKKLLSATPFLTIYRIKYPRFKPYYAFKTFTSTDGSSISTACQCDWHPVMAPPLTFVANQPKAHYPFMSIPPEALQGRNSNVIRSRLDIQAFTSVWMRYHAWKEFQSPGVTVATGKLWVLGVVSEIYLLMDGCTWWGVFKYL